MLVNKNKNLKGIIFYPLALYFVYKIGTSIATEPPVYSIALMIGLMMSAFFLRHISLSVYAFMTFASMPAFLSGLIILRGVNLVNFFWFVMVTLVLFGRYRMGFQSTCLDKNVGLVIIVILVSLIRTHLTYGMNTDQWLYNLGKPLEYIVLYWIIYNYLSNKQDIRQILFVNVVISSVLAVLLLWYYKMGLGIGYSDMEARTGGLHSNPNMLTMLFIFNMLIIIFMLETTRTNGVRIFLVSALIFLIFGIIFSYTRVSYFGTIMAGVVYYLLNANRIRMIGFVLLVGIVIAFLPTTAVERAKSVAEMRDGKIVLGGSAINRLELVTSGIKYLMDNPTKILIGGGSGDYEKNAFRYSKSHYVKEGRDPHNSLIGYTCQIGVLGLAIVGLLYYRIYRVCKSLRRRGCDGFTRKFSIVLQTQMVVYFFYSMAATSLLMWDAEPASICFGSMVGCALVLEKRLDLKSAERIDSYKD